MIGTIAIMVTMTVIACFTVFFYATGCKRLSEN